MDRRCDGNRGASIRNRLCRLLRHVNCWPVGQERIYEKDAVMTMSGAVSMWMLDWRRAMGRYVMGSS